MPNELWKDIDENQSEILSGGKRGSAPSTNIKNLNADVAQVNAGNGTINYFTTYIFIFNLGRGRRSA
jgi:hypothetical protein